MELLRSELEAERLSKEREIQKMATKREEEAAEYKKQLASIAQALETEKRKSPSVQEVMPEPCTCITILLRVHKALLVLCTGQCRSSLLKAAARILKHCL